MTKKELIEALSDTPDTANVYFRDGDKGYCCRIGKVSFSTFYGDIVLEKDNSRILELDEAIKHCDEVIISCDNKDCTLDHERLKSWLVELKERRLKELKVWINKRYNDYEGGMILVAANSAEEAHKTVHNDPRYSYLSYQKRDGTYIDYHYASTDWREVPRLSYNGLEPCVIDEDGYSE